MRRVYRQRMESSHFPSWNREGKYNFSVQVGKTIRSFWLTIAVITPGQCPHHYISSSTQLINSLKSSRLYKPLEYQQLDRSSVEVISYNQVSIKYFTIPLLLWFSWTKSVYPILEILPVMILITCKSTGLLNRVNHTIHYTIILCVRGTNHAWIEY